MAVMCSCGNRIVDPYDPEAPVEPAQPIVLTKAESGVKDCANAFGFDVYRKIYSDKDMFYSPLSLSLALAMTSNGAGGTTQECMRKTLGFGEYSEAEMNSYFRKMTASLSSIDEKTVFEAANAIWADKGIALKDGFVKDCTDWYQATVKSSSFAEKSTVSDINAWCSEKTHGKINAILDELSPDMKMVLLNALYFKGKWAFKFSDDSKFDFKSLAGKSSSVTCLSDEGSFPYAEDKYFQAVELQYGNGAFGMVVLLPKEGIAFKDAVASLNAESWSALTSSMYSSEVLVKIPQFKMETMYDLGDVLCSLGMGEAFSGAADFSKMTSTPLCIGFVKQKAFVDVNKEGTEAAAVTVVGMKVTSVGPVFHKTFIADRPFLFAIRERSTGSILFMGQKTQ